jgi:hypothetical protein
LKLYDEDGRKYTGVVDVNSLWGYQIAIEKDNWGDVYKAGEGDALAGTLVFQAENNIPAPAPGLYFFDVSLKDSTYALTAIGSEIYVQGMDDTWNFDTPLAATATPGVYSGAISFGTLPWGLKIHPVKDAWTPFYGGADGLLALGGQAIGYDNGIAPGTYTMTVDLVNGTYTLE